MKHYSFETPVRWRPWPGNGPQSHRQK